MEIELHGDLIEEILLRLPVKSLFRFKCVRKSWLSLISDPHFAKSHFELSASNRVLCIASSVREARSIDVDASLHDDSAVVSLIPPLPLPDKPVGILGSCRGLILLGRSQYPNLYLWNPSTGLHRQLSCPVLGSMFFDPGTETPVFPIGFGYDPSTDDYLVVVVAVVVQTTKDNCFAQATIYVFSFRTNSWKGFDTPYLDSHHPGREEFNLFGLFFNGAIHWLVRIPVGVDLLHQIKYVDVIMIFDLIEKNLSEIYLPKFHSPSDGACHGRLSIMGGCLTVCYWDSDFCSTHMLMMKEYKVESSWTMFVLKNTRDFLPLCFAKGGELVALSDQSELMKLNANGDLLEQRKYYDHTSCMAVMYRESLFSPVTGVEA